MPARPAVSLDEISDTLLPRRYQEEIFTRAQQSNVIAALDTGSGKTYISTLLIRWIAAQNSDERKIIVFLVPKVPLVHQQGDFIARQTSLRVCQLHGAISHEMNNRESWKEQFNSADVFVMTAQVFLNTLTHSHWRMSKVALIVFDECHHARKNHTYNGVMREYFQTAPESRPKIFGMTASPIWNPKNASESLAILEKNLDAKVIAVKEHIEELTDHSPRPEEKIHVYPMSPNLENLPPEVVLPVERILTRYEVTYYNIGPYGAEYYLFTEVTQRVTILIGDAISHAIASLTPDQYAKVAAGGSMEVIEGVVHPRLLQLRGVLQDFRSFFAPAEGEPQIEVPFTWCSPKVKALTEVLFRRHTPDFQGIVFVEQRHVASCLATILERMPMLAHIIKTEQLIGHGAAASNKSQQSKGMASTGQEDTVKMFREKKINLLVATSVAEEGLDFPACDVVIRFDPVQHMVGYLQSRGRARHKTSTFVIMVQEGAQAQAERYFQFKESEPELKKVYQDRELNSDLGIDEIDEDSEELDQEDLDGRERYVVPSTGAVLTYTSAIGILNLLCAMIRRDRFTPVHVPKYVGDYTSTVHLPSSLPLPPEDLVEAKRAAAFVVVKRLHMLNVLDDYLLPAKKPSFATEDADGVPIMSVRKVPELLDVSVRDPWILGSTLWLHIVYVDGVPAAGVVTGTSLPSVELVASGFFLSTDEGTEIVLHPQHAWSQRRAMEDYTRMGLWWCVTGRGLTLPLTCYLVPINRDLRIDFDAIDLAVSSQFGSTDWKGVGEEQCGQLLYVNMKHIGHPMLLHRLRPDITPSSKPRPGSTESAYPTYRDYWLHKYTRRGVTPQISRDGPCVEGIPLARNVVANYALDNSPLRHPPQSVAQETVTFPVEFCRWAVMPPHVYHAFLALPQLLHRLTDIYRARALRVSLSLPPLSDDTLVQALTLPNAAAAFNNQRLETLGDAVLKLAAVTHLYIRFPHRHEGQLDYMKRTVVSNHTLLARGLERGLERSSRPRTRACACGDMCSRPPPGARQTRTRAVGSTTCACRAPGIVRRSLQDCMEALLGAAWATGGVDMALRTGTALGLAFGGPGAWGMRRVPQMVRGAAAPAFAELQETLGYTFRHGQLLFEAMTHPSLAGGTSYQRLEFLGDAVVDMVVTEYLYKKFPRATSGELSWARSRAVCSPALASVAVKRLRLHKMILINNIDLSMAIEKYVPVLEAISEEEVVLHGWKQDPPKALSDVLESVVGAVFVDCGYDYDKAAAVVQVLLEDLIAVLRPDLPKDPVSELMVWVGQSGCRAIRFARSQSRPEVRRPDSVSVLVHDVTVVAPMAAPNNSMAKGLASEAARRVLADPESEHYLRRLSAEITPWPNHVDMEGVEGVEETAGGVVDVGDMDDESAEVEKEAFDAKAVNKEELDDETVEGFAMLARTLFEGTNVLVLEDEDDATEDDEYAELDHDTADEREVERMLELDET
ncbi:uncharacterized protein BXZ73DRAFT_92224 [Epithele typhae]|uniref:uncharacterized protein n=1 Tax=Epithele typhae TaxID=378194 RepID=UPI0020074F95|nr:uncharacterized protein BXZ73DRAFT_92224 [Epithele typhae]KAH9918392.1 hypothetical protein BXZ73DRAFT_92224 [Epithele typhae]